MDPSEASWSARVLSSPLTSGLMLACLSAALFADRDAWGLTCPCMPTGAPLDGPAKCRRACCIIVRSPGMDPTAGRPPPRPGLLHPAPGQLSVGHPQLAPRSAEHRFCATLAGGCRDLTSLQGSVAGGHHFSRPAEPVVRALWHPVPALVPGQALAEPSSREAAAVRWSVPRHVVTWRPYMQCAALGSSTGRHWCCFRDARRPHTWSVAFEATSCRCWQGQAGFPVCLCTVYAQHYLVS